MDSQRRPSDGLSRRTVLQSLGLAGGGALGSNLAVTGVGARSHGGAGSSARTDSDRRPCSGGDGDGSPPLPGPAVLYDDPVTAPQLEPHGRWEAAPLLVCGADAHTGDEYVFQSFIYDDNGANTSPTNTPPNPRPSDHTFGPMTGDIVYPEDESRYGNNAADLLEFRAQSTRDGIAYRIALNTMLEPDAAAVAIGIDCDGRGGTDEWGYGLGSLGELGLDHVIASWGTGAELDGNPDRATVTVDVERNQLELEVDLDPDGETWRHYLVVGLWDDEEHAFKQIKELPDESSPGGSRGQDVPPVFNVGFRFTDQEPLGTPNLRPERAAREVDHAVEESTGARGIGYGHWRDHAQAKALADRDISQFFADIEFDRLERGRDRFRVPETAFINRLYVSRYDLGVGISPIEDQSRDADVLRNDIVPYAIYVPETYDPEQPCPLHVHLHSLTATHNQYASLTPRFLEELGDDNETIVLTPSGRGPIVPYENQAELDVFEAMADVRARYSVDLERLTIGGYSNGGLGTLKLSSQFPDLFARAFPIVGAIGDETTGEDVYFDIETIADNLRTVPIQLWSAVADELVPFPLVAKYEQRLRELGWRHEHRIFPETHTTMAYIDEWDGGIEFLVDDEKRETAPQRVRYRAVPSFDNESLDLVHDGAHWIHDIRVADGERSGVVDARSLAFGQQPPLRDSFERPGEEPRPHHQRGIEWSRDLSNPTPAAENRLEIGLERVTEVTVYVDTAEIDPADPIELAVETDESTTITLVSDAGTEPVDVPPGETTRTIELCQ